MEKNIEDFLIKKVKELGGLCLKFTSTGTRGVPDRIVILPQGVIHFIELKNENKGVISKLQERLMGRLHDLNCNVYVLSSVEEVNAWSCIAIKKK